MGVDGAPTSVKGLEILTFVWDPSMGGGRPDVERRCRLGLIFMSSAGARVGADDAVLL